MHAGDKLFGTALVISLSFHAAMVFGWESTVLKVVENYSRTPAVTALTYRHGEDFRDSGSDSGISSALAEPVPIPQSVVGANHGGFQFVSSVKTSAETRLANHRNAVKSSGAQIFARQAKVENINLTDAHVFRVFSSYYASISEKIKSQIKYPDALAASGREDAVYLSFLLHATGHISNLEIVEHATQPLFDKTASESIELAAPFAPFPPEINERVIKLYLPISFKQN